MCQKQIVTIHAPGGPFTIYCRECFRSDKWSPLDYGRDYDFDSPFFTQYRRLMEAVPRPALTGSNLVNSDYTHACESIKNCYYTFFSFQTQDSENCYALFLSQNCFDCYVTDNSNQAYESLHSNRLYRVSFGYFADECLESSFLYDCVGCSDCFGCINLRKQKYCIFNEQFSKEDYKERIKYWDIGSYAKLKEAKKKFRELYLSTPHRYANIHHSQDVTGDIIRDAKNCHACFSALDGVENCKYLYLGGLNLKDSMDVSGVGLSSALLYEVFGITGNAFRCFFSVGGGNSQNTWYSDWANNSSDIFGCISVKNVKNCILNKKYSKDEYEAMITKIKKQMDEVPYVDKKGRIYKFGEFFPTELSAYAYNECFGFPFYPKTKEAVLAENWRWQESAVRSYNITKEPLDLPDNIRDTPDSICNEIVGCIDSDCGHQCTTAFRISKNELNFYRSMNVALPRKCPTCRTDERFAWRNRYTLWERQCMCAVESHGHGKQCINRFETTFSPEKPEIIYCDQCYKAEFI
ncbi:MAG: hypothetical protein WC764_01685 [Candidatus Paceibacterota bacterium]